MIEFQGNIAVTAAIAILAAFVTQAVKQAIPEEYHRFIPLPLAIILIGAGVLLAYLTGGSLVDGGVGGMVAAALAVYGFEFVSNVLMGGRRTSD